MKRIFVLVLVCLLKMNFFHGVVAERMVRFIFNDGIPPTPNNECTESDFEHIDRLFNITSYLDRRYRRLSHTKATIPKLTHMHDDRVLRNYPAKCKDNCAGLVEGTCRASGCQGYRRRSLSDGNDKVSCEAQIASISDEIDLLIQKNTLSLPCQTFMLKSKRKSECYDDVVYGEIVSFTFFTSTVSSTNRWNQQQLPTIKKLQENVPNGHTICNSVPLNIEIVLNPCVNVVNFTLTGGNNMVSLSRIDSQHPMILFEPPSSSMGWTRSSTASTYGTRHLPPGSYSLKATPDNFSYKEKTLDFRVIAC